MARARRSAIVGYHGVGPFAAGEDPRYLRVPTARFRAQVELLRDAGFEFLTVAELAARAGGGPPPPGLVALSFDDGMADNHAVLLPLLREYGIRATVYVATGMIGARNPWMSDGSGARMMTADELRELHEAGVELGAHTVTHPDLSALDHAACLDEMRASRATLEDLTGEPVRTFAYPFCRYGPDAVAAARDAGFEAAVTCEGRGGWRPFELKRAMLTGKDGMPSFMLKLLDAYQPLFDSRVGSRVRASTRSTRRRWRALRAHDD
jgi:peptidoglycan/xylan/chitin deacetylase (PgdA/CDA1 family)